MYNISVRGNLTNILMGSPNSNYQQFAKNNKVFGVSSWYRRKSANRRMRHQIEAVIPSLQGEASSQLPPDLPSFIFKERIVYLGMTLVPSVTELILAELLYLQYEDNKKPINLYINSTGTSKEGQKYGYDSEAFAIFDTIQYVKPPVHTVAIGTAWGEAAMLLAAGKKGQRAALSSASIMIKQPINSFRGQASELEIQRNETRNTKTQMLKILSISTGKSVEEVEKDINRPKYFDPQEAKDYGLIDKVKPFF